MKRDSRAWLVVPFLVVGCAAAGLAQTGAPREDRAAQVRPAGRSTLAAQLGVEVGEIAHATTISRAKKEKRVSTAVRVTVVAATAYKQNPDEILGIGLDLAAAAARAAPAYAEVIANAVSFAPTIARIDGASSQIRTAVFAAVSGPKPRSARPVPSTEYSAAPAPPAETRESPTLPAQSRRVVSEMTTPPPEAEFSTNAYPPTALPAAVRSKVSLGANGGLSVTADLSVHHDDNVFWTKADKVGDTIIAAAPGAEYHFGQNSLTHGGLRYKEAFTRYADKTAPNVNLGSGGGDFGYADDRLTLAASATYDQLNQSNPDILALGRRTLLRTDVLAIGGSIESQLTAKISAKAGEQYRRTEYKTLGLVTSQHVDWPVSLYFRALPKLDLSTGFTYGQERPQGGGPTGKDLYYNIGLRGSLTPKLSSEFSMGYQTREVGANPKEHLLAFDGSFNYELTPKTTAVLVLSRGFSASALGETLKNGSYRLGLTTDLTPQWRIGTNLAFRSVDYGTAEFTLNNIATSARRKDDYWEGSLDVTYLWSQWLSASANYTVRSNRSTLPAVEFSNNILGLILGLRY